MPSDHLVETAQIAVQASLTGHCVADYSNLFSTYSNVTRPALCIASDVIEVSWALCVVHYFCLSPPPIRGFHRGSDLVFLPRLDAFLYYVSYGARTT